MKTIKYIIYKEGKYYISQSLNVDVSSFGKTIEEATKNLKEALDLYFEEEPARKNYQKISESILGELSINIR
jgi:predicted RNase H-like HicB family nuclease